ncbi:hypothetical protein A3J43_04195 [Candidatus Uhrbacteria bacterium RIFCSPHIGHO2_12_FULL_54_23]|uniref:Uncharacterized protein n=1 Tax=Candidatus Uhrbacteria bacterium RIFCSPHIGHO2_12_FULL_54_23 TaxID=1802397 RepID=A0A1F7UIJ5_9BACT|nr:MAG: hypothetical protein A3J43_04195 [Candidatus Uhrbacteria bacterium RIFCSPHIGHO2_12_FULL_54_23]
MDTSTESTSIETPSDKKSSSAGIITAIVVILALAGLWALGRYTSIKVPGVPKAGEGAKVAQGLQDAGEGEPWQAVFLSNGQVYFGHLGDEGSQYATLEEVYYLQVQQPLQQATGTTTGQVIGVQQPNAQQQLVLIKFGTELHGPEDRMVINRDHILFWEDLKPDSTVVRSITNYKNGVQE